MDSTPHPDFESIAPPLATLSTAQPASWSRMLLVALPIVLPASLIANMALSLPVRGASAIICGLAVLLGGPYLLGHSLLRWAQK